jgi:hypothetical protein
MANISNVVFKMWLKLSISNLQTPAAKAIGLDLTAHSWSQSWLVCQAILMSLTNNKPPGRCKPLAALLDLEQY